jgi:SAM-dependent methyltransferase
MGRNKAIGMIAGFALVLLSAEWTAHAQEHKPKIGQKGKDVIWVPTPTALVQMMLDLAELTPGDFLMDLGSGDGRIVIAAAERGVRAMGIEYNPDLVAHSKRAAEKAGVSEKANFVNADIFTTDLSDATVITMFLLPDINRKLRPKILALRPGTRVVSHNFDLEDWEPDQVVTYKELRPSLLIAYDSETGTPNRVETFNERRALLWIVPARVAGVWTWPEHELKLHQKFQEIRGTLKDRGRDLPLRSAKLKGDRISFQIGEGSRAITFSGKVSDDTIEGAIKAENAPEAKWSAVHRGTKPPAKSGFSVD